MQRLIRTTATRAALSLLVLGAVVAMPLSAQARPAATPAKPATPMAGGFTRTHAWEFTLSGSVFSVDRALNNSMRTSGIRTDTSRFMWGGDVGITKHLSNNLAFAIGMGLGTGGGAKVLTPRAEVVWTTGINNKMNLFVPLGIGFTRHTNGGVFSTTANRITSTIGLHTGIGFRAFLSENMAFRAEGLMTYDTYEEVLSNGKSNAFNGQGNIGLSWFVGTGRSVDTDGDGIFDNKDRCAATPRGASVDAHGCPTDADHDGVFDGIDRCAATPANTPVDAVGCPRDSDGDGVIDSADRCAGTAAGVRVDATGCAIDADGDGVADAADRCPNTPRGAAVDANGCPRDADGDGVMDTNDRCPNSPAGQAVDATGCPRDTDGDGVPDGVDRCPNTPAGTHVDATGCVLANDADHDNVEDSKDRCPNTPAGTRVDSNGCTIYAFLPAVGASLPIRNIAFRTGASTLLPASYTTLDEMAAGIIATPGSRFEIDGHTDNRGGITMNRTLSANRARSVMNYLIRKGVASNRLTARGFGPDVPIGDNSNDTGRAQNRRVEIKRLS